MRKKKETPPAPVFEKNVLNGIEAIITEFTVRLEGIVCERLRLSPQRYQEIKTQNIMLDELQNTAVMNGFDDAWPEVFNALQLYRSSNRLGFYVTRVQTDESFPTDIVPQKYWSILIKPDAV